MNPTTSTTQTPHSEPGKTLSPVSDACAAVYRDAIMRNVSRVVGLMDREKGSPTYGGLDRTYWAWKFVDFPGARFQEGLCALSFVYATPFDGNVYYHNKKLSTWIAAGFDYWAKIQYPDGSFDEAYPYERSLAATAFTMFYLSEAWELLSGDLPEESDARFKKALRRGAQWLVDNDETHGFLSNHLAAAAGALYHAYRITGEERFERRCRYFLDKILSHQSPEGWYDEYGGADPGYQTHGSFYLARLMQLGADTRLRDSLSRAVRFQAAFIHPDGSLGGEYTSRNTQTYYPAAFEMLSGVDGAARWIAEAMLPSVLGGQAAGLISVDAYNLYPLMNNYVFAYHACLENTHRAHAPAPPSDETQHFPQAGLIKAQTRGYVVYVGLHKGGALKAFDRRQKRLIANDCGYLGRTRGGRLITSQVLDPQRPVEVSGRTIRIKGQFYAIKKPVMNPRSFLAFRAFSLTLGRFKAVSHWLKGLLVRVLIYRKKAVDLHIVRTIALEEEGFTVRDEIRSSSGMMPATLRWQDVFTTIHMGSSRYFVPHELLTVGETYKEVDVYKLKDGVTLERTFTTVAEGTDAEVGA